MNEFSPDMAGVDDRERAPQGRAGASFAGTVALQSVSMERRGKNIIDSVSVRFEAGRISCLLGPSGCGKTSLLRLIAGVSVPTRGSIDIGGALMVGPRHFTPPERRNVGFVFQDFALFPHMTALENVAYGLYALSRDEALAAALRGLERVGLSALANRYPSSLSGGEQQRVALARAVVPRPQVILLDEPFSGLDQRLRDQVRAETIAIVRETRATAILVTHDPNEALDVADQIFLMRDGRLVQQGTAQMVYDHPVDAAAAQFFGSYNVFKGEVTDGGVATAIGRFPAPGLAKGTVADVLVRPLAIAPASKGFPAYVLSCQYLGEKQRLHLVVEGLDTPVVALIAAREPVDIGVIRHFRVDPAGVFVFTSAAPAPT